MSRMILMLVMWCSIIGFFLLGIQKIFAQYSYKEIVICAVVIFISVKLLAYVLRLAEWYFQGDKSLRASVIKELIRVEFPKNQFVEGKCFSDELYNVSQDNKYDVEARVYAAMLAETLRLGDSFLDRRFFNSLEWSLNKAYLEYSSSSLQSYSD